MFRNPRFSGIARNLSFALLLLAGCAGGDRRSRDLPPEPIPQPAAVRDAVIGDTVGAQTLVSSGDPLHLRGFGLVVGLGENGGSDCPSTIREYLLDYLAREFAPRGTGERQPRFSPQRMIDSLDTAVVAVHGLVPAGAPRGTPFDLQIQAVGTQARSLKGGVLMPCELRQFDVAASGKGLVTGRVLARARGAVFTDPAVTSEGAAADRDPRRGFVLGGGRNLEDRPVRLLLQEPSYWMARRIERRVNERFGQDPPAAKAISKGYLSLTTPAEYAQQPERFTQLATHLFLENTPAQVERKLAELAQQLDGPESALNNISLVWEGIGRTVIPRIQPLYSHARAAVRFYAARAGVRLRDVNAVEVLAEVATTPESEYALPAVYELGWCRYPQAARHLAALLDHDDQFLRIAAYEGLRRHRHPAIETHTFPSALDPAQVNVTLDVVESSGEPMVYVRRTLEPRIALFGGRTTVGLPLFYNHPDNLVTLNALAGQTDIAIMGRSRAGRLMAEPLVVPARVVEVLRALADLPDRRSDGPVTGFGLGYTEVVEVVGALCDSGAIPAQLVMQPITAADLLGPAELPERPESDELSPEEPARPEGEIDASMDPGEPPPSERDWE